MGIRLGDSPEMSASNTTEYENTVEPTTILIAIGSVLIVLCAASIIYGLHRRRRLVSAPLRGVSSRVEENLHHPTDFMNSLATWDRCHSIDEIVEKRRSVWTLDIFESFGSSGIKNWKLNTNS